MQASFIEALYSKHQKAVDCPSPKKVVAVFHQALGLLFPEFAHKEFKSLQEMQDFIHASKLEWTFLISKSLRGDETSAEAIVEQFFTSLEALRAEVVLDIEAIFQGDPAAKSLAEVVRTYPGFYAIAAYRIAHFLHKQDIPLIPRIIAEHAHTITGVDIHPAATIGPHFCIDHGTGIVIGETTTIGKGVKIYQGVTLGALSVDKQDASRKRHPSIGDDVVIYAGATILGGETHIGTGSVIGGNVWLVNSVPPHSKVYYNSEFTTKKSTENITTP